MPAHSVKVDRSTLWGNPYRVGDDGIETVEQAVRLFRKTLERPAAQLDNSDWFFMFTTFRIQTALRGYNLACWCRPGTPCHADVLLEIANGPPCPQFAELLDDKDGNLKQEDDHADTQ